MKYFLSLCLLALSFSGLANAAVIVESTEPAIALDLTKESQNYKYQVTITRPITPKKMTGNPFRDSYLRVSCGDTILATDPQRITPSSFGKIMTFQVTFELNSRICPTFSLQTILETNGTIVDSPRLQYEVIKVRETVAYFISHVRSDMPAAKQDIVYYHGEMSKSLGNRVSFHCLIKDYEGDTNVETVIGELISQYKGLFGVDYVASDIDCAVAPKLDVEISECSTKPSLRRNFCSFYKLYTQSLDFFTTSISAAQEQKSSLSAGEATLVKDLDDLIKDLDNAKNDATAQI